MASENKINWQEWSKNAFDQARVQNKPMIINVGHEGCIACRWMKDETFSESGVIEIINKNFVAIQVDSEMRPDIGERYSDWAWPATAFNKPDGTQVLAIRGNRQPDDFKKILNKILNDHLSGKLKADQLAPYAAPVKIRNTPLIQIRNQVRAQLDNSFDDKQGGWGSNKILEHAEPIIQFATRYHLENDKRALYRFMKTADGFMHHIDEVWGGIFYESLDNWDDLIFEKRLETQASALQLFSTAYEITREKRFIVALDHIQRYLNEHLRSESNLYFASQQANIYNPSKEISLPNYYDLDDENRREIGLPSIDRSLYADLNGRVISGLVYAYEATGKTEYLTNAIRTAKALIKHHKINDTYFIQFKQNAEFRTDERVHKVLENNTIYLRPHAYLGIAFVDLHRATANKHWLIQAQSVVNVLKNLQDNSLGGFFATKNQIIPRKPLEDNATAARFLYMMSVLKKESEYHDMAEKAIRASASKSIVEREGRITGNLAEATELLTAGYLEFSIVGNKNDPAAQKLFETSRQVYEPRKILHFEQPGRYPKRDKAALYICNIQACSVPIYDAININKEVGKFLDM